MTTIFGQLVRTESEAIYHHNGKHFRTDNITPMSAKEHFYNHRFWDFAIRPFGETTPIPLQSGDLLSVFNNCASDNNKIIWEDQFNFDPSQGLLFNQPGQPSIPAPTPGQTDIWRVFIDKNHPVTLTTVAGQILHGSLTDYYYRHDAAPIGAYHNAWDRDQARTDRTDIWLPAIKQFGLPHAECLHIIQPGEHLKIYNAVTSGDIAIPETVLTFSNIGQYSTACNAIFYYRRLLTGPNTHALFQQMEAHAITKSPAWIKRSL